MTFNRAVELLVHFRYEFMCAYVRAQALLSVCGVGGGGLGVLDALVHVASGCGMPRVGASAATLREGRVCTRAVVACSEIIPVNPDVIAAARVASIIRSK